LQLGDVEADTVMRFLDHIEAERSNTAATRNCCVFHVIVTGDFTKS
jgi:hypothetical protein